MSHDFFKRIHSSVTITPCCVADRRTNEGGDDQSRKVGKELHTSPLSSLLSPLSPSFQTLLTEILHSFNLNEMVVRVGREGVGFVRSFVRLTL